MVIYQMIIVSATVATIPYETYNNSTDAVLRQLPSAASDKLMYAYQSMKDFLHFLTDGPV